MTPPLLLLCQLVPVTIGAVAQLFTGKRREWTWLVAQAGFIACNLALGMYVFGAASVVYAALGVRNLVLLHRQGVAAQASQQPTAQKGQEGLQEARQGLSNH